MVSTSGSKVAPRLATIRVLVVDDHEVFAELVAMALSNHEGLDCAGIATNLDTAFELIESLKPDLVLMDVQLKDGDGIAATAELIERAPELRVVVLSAFIDSTLMQRAADAGACALMPKDGNLTELLDALRSARPGAFDVHPRLLKELVETRAVPRQRIPPLTPRELDVLRLLAAGLDAAVISRELGISVSTCRGHVKVLLAKMGAHTALEAVVVAMRNGLLGVGDADA